MLICCLQEVSYFGFIAVEVVIYPVGDLQEVSKFGFTAAEVVIYPENLVCGLHQALDIGFTAVEVVIYLEFLTAGGFIFSSLPRRWCVTRCVLSGSLFFWASLPFLKLVVKCWK